MQIIIVSDNLLESWRGKDRFVFEDVDYPKCMVISPSPHENYLNTQLLKLKVFADRNDIKLISYGCYNHFPFYSMFSHEVILQPPYKSPNWYNGATFNYIICPTHSEAKQLGGKWVRESDFRHKVECISDEEVIEHFTNWKVFIRKSSLEAYEKCKKQGLIRKNHLVAEVKFTAKKLRGFFHQFQVDGYNHALQRSILKVTGYNNYMGCQILASQLSNWVYIACGGAGNLFSVIPMRVIYFSEFNLRRPSASNILRQLAIKRYGDFGKIFPLIRTWCLHDNKNCEEDKVIKDLIINLNVIQKAALELQKIQSPNLENLYH